METLQLKGGEGDGGRILILNLTLNFRRVARLGEREYSRFEIAEVTDVT